MSFVERVQKLAGKLKLGPHHEMERYVGQTAFFAATGLILLPMVVVSAVNAGKDEFTSTAIYTPEFTTSLSQTEGILENVYVSPDRHRAMVMIEFNEPELRSVSSNAENYEVYITATNENLGQENLATNLVGEIVSFGNTGHMAVVITSDEPIEQQILGMTVRNNSQAAVGEAGEDPLEDSLGDESFKEFDQWRLFFNPGATGAVELQSLQDRNLDVEGLYWESQLRGEEEIIRGELDLQLATMKNDLAFISELEAELDQDVDGVRIEPPMVPNMIAGDMVYGDLGEGREILGSEEIPGEGFPKVYEQSDLLLDTADGSELWVDPRGFDLDWRDTSVRDGFLDTLIPEGETAHSYLDNKAAGIASGESVSEEEERGSRNDLESERFKSSDLDWVLTDGTDLSSSYDIPTGLEPLQRLMNDLSQAYQEYYDHKVEYQVDLQTELLELELQLKHVTDNYTHHDGDAVMFG